MAVEKIIKVKAETDEAVKEVNKLNKATEKVNDQTSELTKGGEKGFNKLGKSADSSSKAVGTVSKGFNVLGTAMKAAGIGLVVALVAKLTQAFSRNQKIMDGVNAVFETVNIVMSEVVNAVTDAFNAANDATGGFDALSKVMQGLLTLAVTPLKVGFFSIKLGIQEAQLAFEKSYFGDKDPKAIKELNESIKETRKSLLDTGLDAIEAGKQVVENFSEAVGEVSTLATETTSKISEISISAAKAQADALVEARKQAEINEALIEKSIFKSQLSAERQRQIRDDETKSFAERKAANEELGRILEEQQENELKLAQQRLSAAEEEVAAGDTTTAAKVAVINAEKELLDIKERIAGFESEQQLNRNALNREEKEAIDAQKEALSQLDFEKKRAAAEEIENERARLEALKLIAEEERAFEIQRLEQKLNDTAVETQARIDAETELAERKFELNQKVKESEKDLADFQSKTIEEKLKDEKVLRDQTIALTAQTFGSIASILGEQSKAGKAFAVAQALINTFQGISAGVALGFPLAIPAVAFAASTGFKSVKDILSTNVTSPSANGGGSATSPQAATPQLAQAPQFDLVGDAGVNQISETLNSQSNRPQRSYVVSSEMESQAQLERNIQGDASLG